jgi:alkanesulfonate monooxygenase SsuD/methylene tetrahydromethanopterin reductase-like flavin-dependent oxidoreductase (luciferase family)
MESAPPPIVPAGSAVGSPLGVTAAPFIRSGTAAVVDLARCASRLGYDSFWVAEVTGIEAFSVLGAASRAAAGVGLGTGEGMLRLAGAEADGVLLNYLPASHVPWCVEQVRRGGNATIYANIHVGVGDRAAAAPRARYDLFSYAVVDAYASSFTRAGYGDAIKAIRAAHLAGDRAGALAAIPDEMVDAIEVTGDEALVRDTISAYQRAGVDIPVVFPLTWGAAGQDGLESTLRAAIGPPASAPHMT